MSSSASAAATQADPERTPEVAGDEKKLDRSASINWYFVFICVSTAFRSFEAGIISSNVPLIKENLDLEYRHVGMISASPDYGIVPSGLVAIVAFSYMRAYTLLCRGYFVIAIVSFLCVLYPTLWSLVLARALSGFCWGFAAVHYPAWINKWAKEERRTMWLSIFNVMLLLGILMGYIVGSGTRTFNICSWEPLYFAEGVLMLLVSALSSVFDSDLVQVVDFDEKVVVQKSYSDPEAEPLVRSSSLSPQERSLWLTWIFGESLVEKLPKGLIALYLSNIYMYALAIGSLMAGTVGFILYFITSYEMKVMSWDPVVIAAVTAAVFVIGPVGGVIIGGAILTRLGGYQNLQNSFMLTLVSSILVLVAGCGLCWLTSLGVFHNVPIVLMVWSFLFSGAMPTAACNGICVNIVPGTSHIASGIQFFTQNLAKLIIPSISGHVIDRVGLIPGFNSTLIICACGAVSIAILGYREAIMVGQPQKIED